MNNGYTARFYLTRVDTETWADGETISGLATASVTKDYESDSIEDMNISIDGDMPKGYVRLTMESSGEENNERIPLFTGLVSGITRNIKGSLQTRSATCYSVLKPAADKLLIPGWYCPRNTDPIDMAAQLLRDSIKAPVSSHETPLLTSSTVVAENGETHLTMARKLIDGTGYIIRIDGKGRVSIEKENTEPVATLDATFNDILLPELTDENNYAEIPNVLMVVKDGQHVIVKNEDDGSETSINSLGWEKWQREDVSNLNGETLLSYAASKMQEISQSVRTVSYRREFDEGIAVGDIVNIALPQAGVVGNFKIKSQQIETGNGALVSEVATVSKNGWRK